MDTVVTVVHFITAFLMIGLILLQQGKGAEMGASFGGGSSQTVFGSTGSSSVFGRITTVLTVVFFVTSLSLALIARNEASRAVGADSSIIEALQSEMDIIPGEVDEAEIVMPVDDLGSEEIPTSETFDEVESPALEMPTE